MIHRMIAKVEEGMGQPGLKEQYRRIKTLSRTNLKKPSTHFRHF
jgi:hypothetical protein